VLLPLLLLEVRLDEAATFGLLLLLLLPGRLLLPTASCRTQV
jgi:hypothetical protein